MDYKDDEQGSALNRKFPKSSCMPSCNFLFIIPVIHKRTYNDIFDDFLKISDHFPKISEDSANVLRGAHRSFRTFSENV